MLSKKAKSKQKQGKQYILSNTVTVIFIKVFLNQGPQMYMLCQYITALYAWLKSHHQLNKSHELLFKMKGVFIGHPGVKSFLHL